MVKLIFIIDKTLLNITLLYSQKKYLKSLLEGAQNHLLSFVLTPLLKTSKKWHVIESKLTYDLIKKIILLYFVTVMLLINPSMLLI